MRRPIGRLLPALVALLAILASAAPAGAHAEVRESDPPADGTAPTGQDEVTITFIAMDDEVPPEIDVVDPSGESIVTAPPTIAETASTGTTVVVPVAPLEEGEHEVRWIVMSSDGDGPAAGSFEYVAEERSTSGPGVWLLWIVALGLIAAVFLRPGSWRRRG